MADDDWDVPAPVPSAGRGRGRGNPTARVTSSADDSWNAAPSVQPKKENAPLATIQSAPAEDDWDTPAPKPAAGAGRGTLSSRFGDMKVSEPDENWNTPVTKSVGNWQTAVSDMPTPSIDNWVGGSSSEQPRGASWNTTTTTTTNGTGFSGGGTGGNRACFKCKEEGHMSRDCPNAATNGGGGFGSRTCHKCGEEGHMSRDCPRGGGGGGGGGPRTCHKCGEEGHISRDCPQGGGGQNRGCRKCGEEGHIARECPQGGGDSRACFKCKQEGHMSRDCPMGGEDGSAKGCFKCHSTGHMARDCQEPVSELTADGKPREQYVPPDVTDEHELFGSGIAIGNNFANFEKVALQMTGQDVPQYISSFDSAGLRPLVLENIKASGYSKPTPVQKGAIAVILAKRDLIASAVTGSGKTAAYLVPVINNLLEKGVPGGSFGMTQHPEVVVLAPTRELAIQIHLEARKFSNKSCLKAVIAYGGTQVNHQRAQLQAGCNILVATVGRLKDFVDKQALDFSNVEYFILDEADRMLDMGFGPEIDQFFKHPTMPPTGARRTLMFSATFPEEVQRIAAQYLENYIFVTTGQIGGTNPDVAQEFHEVTRNDKRGKLQEVLQNIGQAKTIVFVESKKTADFIAAFLCNAQFPATSIHGDRLQSQREQAIRDFKRSERSILVATNVAARGLDIAGVEYVVNYDLPNDIEEYVHRVGRTGRVGNVGRSITFYDPERDADKAGKLVEKLVQSNADVPAFLQSAVSGIGGIGYNFNAPGQQSGFSSRDMRHFTSSNTTSRPLEQEESWD